MHISKASVSSFLLDYKIFGDFDYAVIVIGVIRVRISDKHEVVGSQILDLPDDIFGIFSNERVASVLIQNLAKFLVELFLLPKPRQP